MNDSEVKTTEGSYDNPFSDVHSAFDYILEKESDLLANDKSMAKRPPMLAVNFETGQVLPTWLLCNGAHIAYEYPQSSFIVTRQQSGKFSFKPNLAGRKFLFRGQVKDYKNSKGEIVCVPGLFRDESKDYFLEDLILSQEMWTLIDSHPLVDLLGNKGVNLCGYHFKMFTNYGGISQHYFNKTTFLDLTSDVEVAKFFACSDYNPNDDTYSPHIDRGIGVIYYYEICLPLAFQRFPPGYIEPSYHLSTIGKQVFPRSGAQHGYLMDLSKGLDFNNLKYTRKVYFKHHPEVSEMIFQQSNRGLNYMPPDVLDKYWKEKMDNPRFAKTISINALRKNLEYNPEETNSSLRGKLHKRGFSIVDEAPRFNHDQLNSFYQDIKNGWWEDVFTSDIYFYGEDGLKYQKAFRSLRSNSDYKEFFEPKSF